MFGYTDKKSSDELLDIVQKSRILQVFLLQNNLPQKPPCPSGEIGRRTGLKILSLVRDVRVQVPPRTHSIFPHSSQV
jgi:hypothetical protein